MLTVLLRTLLIYLLLIASLRLIGKRQIGELQLSELITTLLLSELAVAPISDLQLPMSRAVLPIITILILEISVSFCTSRLPWLRKLLYGAPSILIHKGKLNMKEMLHLRMDISELISELRLKDIADIADVRCAILEDNGKLSVFQNAKGVEYGISLPVLVHGQYMTKAMRFAGVNKKWITQWLERHKLNRRDVLLLSVDERRRAVYILKDSPDGAIVEEK
ncbi:MAG: DUF421 domain-containing protein [Ruminococcaceae bacterium]|nr:DUF421 domain-containing protein [Oscillospiraceae bacterium]